MTTEDRVKKIKEGTKELHEIAKKLEAKRLEIQPLVNELTEDECEKFLETDEEFNKHADGIKKIIKDILY